jgi:hypothetical protein
LPETRALIIAEFKPAWPRQSISFKQPAIIFEMARQCMRVRADRVAPGLAPWASSSGLLFGRKQIWGRWI